MEGNFQKREYGKESLEETHESERGERDSYCLGDSHPCAFILSNP